MALLRLQALPGLVFVLRFQTWKKPLLGESMQLWHSLFLARIRGSKGQSSLANFESPWRNRSTPRANCSHPFLILPSSTAHFSWGFWPTGPRPFWDGWEWYMKYVFTKKWGCESVAIWGGVGRANTSHVIQSAERPLSTAFQDRVEDPRDAFWGTHNQPTLEVSGSLFCGDSSYSFLHKDSWQVIWPTATT